MTIAAPSDRIIKTSWSIAPDRAGHIAVICGPRAFVILNQDPSAGAPMPMSARPLQWGDISSLAPVAVQALQSNIENVFILSSPGGHFSRMAQRFHHLADINRMSADAPGYVFHELTWRPSGLDAVLVGVVGQAERGGPLVTIWGPSAVEAWNLGGLPAHDSCEARAYDLAYSWLLASYSLGLRLRFSPSYSGLALLRQLLSSSRRNYAQPSERFRDLIVEAQARPLGWMTPARLVAPDEPPVRVWSYDRNWSYITSARAVPLGDPTPVYDFIPNKPGLYRVQATIPAHWPATRPDPIATGWNWEPQIRLALEHGWRVKIHEGYSWCAPGATADLRPFSERMWNSRNSLAYYGGRHGAPAQAARALIKQVGLSSIGRLNQRHGRMLVARSAADGRRVVNIDVDEEGELTGLVEVEADLGRSDLSRPEWWSTIIANANERALAACYQHAPNDALVGWVDAWYVPSPRGLEGDPNLPGKWHLESAGAEIPASVAYGGDVQRFLRAVKAASHG
jgi:hypothetical protein